MTRYIFCTGGVVSSLGKGLAAASIARLLEARDFKVTIQKLDPYLNVDPGTSRTARLLWVSPQVTLSSKGIASFEAEAA